MLFRSQSGSNRILSKMKRGYTREKYLELVNKIRDRVPDATLSTDMICGFPSETAEDFEDSLDLLKRVKYETSFLFYYSERRDTEASSMEDSVPVEVRKSRLAAMIEIQREIQSAVYANWKGSTQEVLVEGPAKRGEGSLKGYTPGNIPVIFPANEALVGTYQKVLITGSTGQSLLGSLS